MQQQHDIIIVGSGHNALVAACYLAKAGKKVLILEKNDYIGGATTSQRVFPEFDTNLSRYSYLVSLLPDQIIEDLGLDLKLLQRKIASYTPYANSGLLISNENEDVSRASVLKLGFGEAEYEGFKAIYQKTQQFAEIVWDSFLAPLCSKTAWQKHFEEHNFADLWQAMVERPIGQFIESHLQSDILRGVVMTDAKIGAFTNAHDESLLQNRTFLYHIVGNKTGEWRVPQGGMGALVAQLIQKALDLGVTINTNVEVADVALGTPHHTVIDHHNVEYRAPIVLLNVLPPKVQQLLGFKPTREDEGTAFKINLLLKKLPQLKDTTVRPEEAFCGTFHINQSYQQMETSFGEAIGGTLPNPFPCEVYSHSLTDPSILSLELQAKGYQTMTVFGIDMAHKLFEEEHDAQKKRVLQLFYDGINQYLVEPIQDCIAQDSAGNHCVEAKSAVDLAQALGMPRGNIFHSALSWFYAENETETNTWGVETPYERLYLAGSAAKRGGAVSGIVGHNVAMKVLSLDSTSR